VAGGTRWGWPAVFLGCVLAAGARSIATGKDANWDLKNYHWYNAWALLNGRMGWDLAPAQIQTYYNPIGDLPFHFLVQVLPWPRHVSFWMALPAAVSAFFLIRILVLLFPPGQARGNLAWIFAALAIGVTGASGQATLGSTMNEWFCAAFVMGALWLSVRAVTEGEDRHPRAFAHAALLAGCAVGFKLTYAIFAVGLLAAFVSFGPAGDRLRRATGAIAMMAAGFTLFGGYWAWTLWREFGNPVFPYFNHVFHSPWWEPLAYFDRAWGPKQPLHWAFFPFYIPGNYLLASEVPFTDYRLAALFVLAVPAALKRLTARRNVFLREAEETRNAWRLLIVFALATYAAWLKLFGIYRYLVPIEVVSGALIVGAVVYLLRGVGWRYAVTAVLAAMLIATTRPADWGRIPYGRGYFENVAPALPARSLVILGYVHPYAYEITFFQPDARFVSPYNNFIRYGEGNLLSKRINEVIRSHTGPVFILEMKSRLPADLQTVTHFGFEYAPGPCLPIRSPMADNYEQVCPLRRLSPA